MEPFAACVKECQYATPSPAVMPTRRLQDRIRELSGRLLYENEPEWTATVRELQMALQEHILRMANVTTALVVTGAVLGERREGNKE